MRKKSSVSVASKAKPASTQPDSPTVGPGSGPELLTVKETSQYLRIPLPTVYYLVQRGQLPAVQIGGRWRVKRESLDRDILRKEEEGQPTALVLDDDPAIQDLFKVFLRKIGFSRIIVGTAAEALSALHKQRFDIMFLDLQLPDGTGDEVYAAAKEIDPDLSIVIATGYPDSDILDRILSRGPVTVLKKPLTLEGLIRTARLHGHDRTPIRAISRCAEELPA